MVAKTYKQDEFYLRDNLDELQDYLLKEDYDGIDELVFLRTVSVHKTQKCSESDILDIKSDDILALWEKTTTSIIQATRHLKDEIGITSPKILPYSTMLVPLSYFFFRLGNKTFHEEYKSAINKWFWRSSLSGRYQAHTNEIIHNDCLWFDELIQNKTYEPRVPKFEINEETILETVLNLNNASSNSILCLLASKKPIDFYNHQTIKINEVLIKGKKSELHHIFPRNSKTGKENSNNIDSIANICFLPRDTNRLFSNKEPSNYFSISLKNNSIYFLSDLETHLIPPSNNSPIWTDEYDKFLKQRATLIKNEINKILDYLEILPEDN
ncbi:MAG: hypothetical protein VR69_16085 [Peptococcaceae bacterium BRH_c4b]|nr:MAG: hypothetical protein VR69_16085 [Peptococcaceae bacterium BRH_c4b]